MEELIGNLSFQINTIIEKQKNINDNADYSIITTGTESALKSHKSLMLVICDGTFAEGENALETQPEESEKQEINEDMVKDNNNDNTYKDNYNDRDEIPVTVRNRYLVIMIKDVNFNANNTNNTSITSPVVIETFLNRTSFREFYREHIGICDFYALQSLEQLKSIGFRWLIDASNDSSRHTISSTRFIEFLIECIQHNLITVKGSINNHYVKLEVYYKSTINDNSTSNTTSQSSSIGCIQYILKSIEAAIIEAQISFPQNLNASNYSDYLKQIDDLINRIDSQTPKLSIAQLKELRQDPTFATMIRSNLYDAADGVHQLQNRNKYIQLLGNANKTNINNQFNQIILDQIKTILRPYQLMAVEWMYLKEKEEKCGAILAEKTGTGKTLVTISLMIANQCSNGGKWLMANEVKSHPVISTSKQTNNQFAIQQLKCNFIICDLPLTRQWAAELSKHLKSPGLKYGQLYFQQSQLFIVDGKDAENYAKATEELNVNSINLIVANVESEELKQKRGKYNDTSPSTQDLSFNHINLDTPIAFIEQILFSHSQNLEKERQNEISRINNETAAQKDLQKRLENAKKEAKLKQLSFMRPVIYQTPIHLKVESIDRIHRRFHCRILSSNGLQVGHKLFAVVPNLKPPFQEITVKYFERQENNLTITIETNEDINADFQRDDENSTYLCELPVVDNKYLANLSLPPNSPNSNNPCCLHDYDVILMDTDTLERYKASNHRLLWDLQFHRIILDEIHTISDRKTPLFYALTKLNSNYYWALTGTPFRKPINRKGNQNPIVLSTLKTILEYIGYTLDTSGQDLFHAGQITQYFLNNPYEKQYVHSLINKNMWRSSSEFINLDLAMLLKPVHFILNRIELSEMETHLYYMKQYEIQSVFSRQINKLHSISMSIPIGERSFKSKRRNKNTVINTPDQIHLTLNDIVGWQCIFPQGILWRNKAAYEFTMNGNNNYDDNWGTIPQDPIRNNLMFDSRGEVLILQSPYEILGKIITDCNQAVEKTQTRQCHLIIKLIELKLANSAQANVHSLECEIYSTAIRLITSIIDINPVLVSSLLNYDLKNELSSDANELASEYALLQRELGQKHSLNFIHGAANLPPIDEFKLYHLLEQLLQKLKSIVNIKENQIPHSICIRRLTDWCDITSARKLEIIQITNFIQESILSKCLMDLKQNAASIQLSGSALAIGDYNPNIQYQSHIHYFSTFGGRLDFQSKTISNANSGNEWWCFDIELVKSISSSQDFFTDNNDLPATYLHRIRSSCSKIIELRNNLRNSLTIFLNRQFKSLGNQNIDHINNNAMRDDDYEQKLDHSSLDEVSNCVICETEYQTRSKIGVIVTAKTQLCGLHSNRINLSQLLQYFGEAVPSNSNDTQIPADSMNYQYIIQYFQDYFTQLKSKHVERSNDFHLHRMILVGEYDLRIFEFLKRESQQLKLLYNKLEDLLQSHLQFLSKTINIQAIKENATASSNTIKFDTTNEESTRNMLATVVFTLETQRNLQEKWILELLQHPDSDVQTNSICASCGQLLIESKLIDNDLSENQISTVNKSSYIIDNYRVTFPSCSHFMHGSCYHKLWKIENNNTKQGLNSSNDISVRCPYSTCGKPRHHSSSSPLFMKDNLYIEIAKQRSSMYNYSIPLNRYPQYSSKIDRIVHDLPDLRNKLPGNKMKVIIFSAYRESLLIMGLVLLEKNIQFRGPAKSKKLLLNDIQKFQLQSEIEILLVPLEYGNAGLNLQFANIIIYMEPTDDSIAFSQSMARILRMGQINPMYIIFYIAAFHHDKSVIRNHAALISDDTNNSIPSVNSVLPTIEEIIYSKVNVPDPALESEIKFVPAIYHGKTDKEIEFWAKYSQYLPKNAIIDNPYDQKYNQTETNEQRVVRAGRCISLGDWVNLFKSHILHNNNNINTNVDSSTQTTSTEMEDISDKNAQKRRSMH